MFGPESRSMQLYICTVFIGLLTCLYRPCERDREIDRSVGGVCKICVIDRPYKYMDMRTYMVDEQTIARE